MAREPTTEMIRFTLMPPSMRADHLLFVTAGGRRSAAPGHPELPPREHWQSPLVPVDGRILAV
jgi:hypothetical protein